MWWCIRSAERSRSLHCQYTGHCAKDASDSPVDELAADAEAREEVIEQLLVLGGRVGRELRVENGHSEDAVLFEAALEWVSLALPCISIRLRTMIVVVVVEVGTTNSEMKMTPPICVAEGLVMGGAHECMTLDASRVQFRVASIHNTWSTMSDHTENNAQSGLDSQCPGFLHVGLSDLWIYRLMA